MSAGLLPPGTTTDTGTPAPASPEPSVILTAIRDCGDPFAPGSTRVVYTARFVTPTGPDYEQIATVSYLPAVWNVRPYIVAFKGEDPRKTGEGVKNRHATEREARQRAREALGEWAAGCLGWQWGGGEGEVDA